MPVVSVADLGLKTFKGEFWPRKPKQNTQETQLLNVTPSSLGRYPCPSWTQATRQRIHSPEPKVQFGPPQTLTCRPGCRWHWGQHSHSPSGFGAWPHGCAALDPTRSCSGPGGQPQSQPAPWAWPHHGGCGGGCACGCVGRLPRASLLTWVHAYHALGLCPPAPLTFWARAHCQGSGGLALVTGSRESS